MEANPNIDFGIFPSLDFTEIEDLKKAIPYRGVENPREDALTSFLAARFQYTVWTNIYRRESLVKKNITWDEEILVYQDFDFNISTLAANLKYRFCKNAKPDYFYRISYTADTVCSTFSDSKFKSTESLIEKILVRLSMKEDYNQRKNEFLGFILQHFDRLLHHEDMGYVNTFLVILDKYYGGTVGFRYKMAAMLSELFCFNKYVVIMSLTFFCGSSIYVKQLLSKF